MTLLRKQLRCVPASPGGSVYVLETFPAPSLALPPRPRLQPCISRSLPAGAGARGHLPVPTAEGSPLGLLPAPQLPHWAPWSCLPDEGLEPRSLPQRQRFWETEVTFAPSTLPGCCLEWKLERCLRASYASSCLAFSCLSLFPRPCVSLIDLVYRPSFLQGRK